MSKCIKQTKARKEKCVTNQSLTKLIITVNDRDQRFDMRVGPFSQKPDIMKMITESGDQQTCIIIP